MSFVTRLMSLLLVLTLVPLLQAEAHCPGNAASLRFPFVARSLIIVPVVINHAGPYAFLVDTGTQLTIVDPSLASELHLKIQGAANVVGVGFNENSSLARIDSLEVGSRLVENHLVELLDLEPLKTAGLHIRGILGGSFLGHFDVLLDYAHNLLCLDDTKRMRPLVKGVHVVLERSASPRDELPLTGLVIVSVHLSGAGPLQLALDSGTNVPYLFQPNKNLLPGLSTGVSQPGLSTDGVSREYSPLPSQKMQIGSLIMRQVTFFKPAKSDPDIPKMPFDGLLTTTLFRKVFISYSDHLVILDPR
jgi:hypothetical protein